MTERCASSPEPKRVAARVAVWAMALIIGMFLAYHCLFALGLFAEVNKANFDRIEPGMTRYEVYRVFKCPPGDWRTHVPVSPDGIYETRQRALLNGGDSRNWHGDDGSYLVNFCRETGRVLIKSAYPTSEFIARR